MLVVQWWRSFACPVLKPKANDTMIGMVVSSGSHNSIHGRMSARGHQVACSGRAYHVRSWSRKPTLPGLAAAPGAGQTGRGHPMSAYRNPIAAFRAQGRLCHLSAINRHNRRLFDHLGGAQHYRWGYGKTERLGGLEVDDHLELGRKLHREIARLLAAQDAIHIGGGTTIEVYLVGSVGEQTALSG